MNKYLSPFIFFALLLITNVSKAQTPQYYQKFGNVDLQDLTMTSCSFEPDANAMVLFDKQEAIYYADSTVTTRHRRIKILTTKGKSVANIRLPFNVYDNWQKISAIEAQTINLENNKIVYAEIEPRLIYTENIDKHHKAIVFAFPQVSPGSIIEFQYKERSSSYPIAMAWYFQNNLPVRYSDLTINFSKSIKKLKYNIITRGSQPFEIQTEQESTINGTPSNIYHLAKSNIPSRKYEPYSTEGDDNSDRAVFQLKYVQLNWNGTQREDERRTRVAAELCEDENFGGQMDRELSGRDSIIKQVKSLHTNDKKIAYIFDVVKNSMTWNKVNSCYTTPNGVRAAWAAKLGNSTEINLALFNLLRIAGIKSYPMVVSTPDYGYITPVSTNFSGVNKTVIYLPVDSSRYYLLDASNKYNVYNEIPAEQLNTFGIKIIRTTTTVTWQPVFLANTKPAQHLVLINAEINPDNKLTGEATITDDSYGKAAYHQKYDELDKQKYLEYLSVTNKSLRITDLTLENLKNDTLPLIQKFSFSKDLDIPDEKYIYFNPGLFNPLAKNPFLSEQRVSDINFNNCKTYNMHGVFRLPAGYKVDVLPKSTTLNMYDKSIAFKRIVGENNGAIEVHYVITYKRSMYSVKEYASIYDFYKQMFDLLNEPVVLKKAS